MLAWHDALNEQDFDTLLQLSSSDVEVGDADGAAQGHEALHEWAASHRMSVTTGRMFVHDGVVVAEQHITYADGTERTSASAFRVVHDRITSVFRHDDLQSALTATDLSEEDLAN